ncbi:serine/threonine protein kinase [Candidatus Uabimicrobium amorphum]|uniref:Protein kinase n=1 Tax=Uabimicrobium amorphum TaxID=2596890 RepID=A0A5S9IKP9_UABAM|nr:serine/threonine-protein kinase [Candidatus Uabimicrobium amorphum]BBM83484.1 protein kinase [Candidatus Uabimicrobium amorphum]
MDEHKLRQIWEKVASAQQLQQNRTSVTYESINTTRTMGDPNNLPILHLGYQETQPVQTIDAHDTTVALRNETLPNSIRIDGHDREPDVSPHAPTVNYANKVTQDVTQDASETMNFVAETSKYVREVRDNVTTANYHCNEEIGKGGMGIVFRGFQNNLQREIAIKKLRPEKINQEKKFIGEALVTAFLEHPNIVPVHDLGRGTENEILLAMKMVGGTSWKELLHPTQKDSVQKAQNFDRDTHLRILLVVCNAIAFAHSKGIVHNDIKPENVMIGEFGEVQVMDWGLAVNIKEHKESRTIHRSEVAAPMGTPCYIAPELVGGEGDKIGEWTDVYLLGAVLYEIIAGKPPHRGDTMWEVLVSSYKGNMPEFDNAFPRELRNICLKAMAREPQDRYPSVKEFQKAVNKYLRNRESLKFLFLSSIYIVLLLILGSLVVYMFDVQKDLNNKQKIRYLSHLTAQELRQSSDDLTRTARSYVATGDKKYKKMYREILDIRNGKKPRADGRTIPLRNIMKELGFTTEEFAKLKESEDYSNDLVATEVKAMQAVEDGQQQRAIRLMFDEKYQQNKQTITRPIDEFFVMIDNRTMLAVEAYIWRSFICLSLVTLIISILVVVSVMSYVNIYRKVKFHTTLASE